MQGTQEEAIESVRRFEEARKAEGYSPAGPTVLQRVPLMEFKRNGDQNALGFDVKAGVTDHGDGKGWVSNGTWEASLEQRGCVFIADSPEQAIASMLKGVARLAYDGHMHPDRPEDVGVPSIQHALNVMTERLAWQAARREEHVREIVKVGGHDAGPETKTSLMPGIERQNQIIAALGTAVAALARVNDL